VNLLSLHNSPQEIAARTAAIREAVLRESQNLTQPNFTTFGTDDLARLFVLYDKAFFGGELGRAVSEKSGLPLVFPGQPSALLAVPPVARRTPSGLRGVALEFRLSSTMTRAGGKTIHHRWRMADGRMQISYEIAVASRLLFMTFKEDGRPVVVCGLTCKDRLDALQRIIEHEMMHLAELVVFGNTSCSRRRFKDLAADIFGHAGTVHTLVTPAEHAAARHGVRVGDLVRFEIDGRLLAGRINRITQRATVLVESARGTPYSDGKSYMKFYVPLGMLSPASA
jgi:hypothetical protein